MEQDRKTILLKAAYDILKKCDESRYVLNVLEQTATWDNAECDGLCLLEEIAEELGLGCDDCGCIDCLCDDPCGICNKTVKTCDCVKNNLR